MPLPGQPNAGVGNRGPNVITSGILPGRKEHTSLVQSPWHKACLLLMEKPRSEKTTGAEISNEPIYTSNQATL